MEDKYLRFSLRTGWNRKRAPRKRKNESIFPRARAFCCQIYYHQIIYHRTT